MSKDYFWYIQLIILMEGKIFKCPIHPQQDIAFFCTVSQWHFVPLCTECIPPHTQNHPKNFKITIEAFNKVREKSMAQNSVAITEYKKRLDKINQYLTTQRLPEAFQTLEKLHKQILTQINSFFAQIKKQLTQKCQQTTKYQSELLQKLQNNVLADIKDLQNTDQIQEVQQWGQIVRRLYFKDGITPYLEEIDDILKDHQERVYGRKDLCVVNEKKLEEELRKLLTTVVSIPKENKPEQNEQKAKTIVPKDQKKQPKIVIKPKICKNCNGQLQYLTQLKKHLFCPQCGGKQRNYIPKKA